MVSKKTKLLLISLICIVFIVLIVLAGFRLAQLSYIYEKLEGKDGENPPPNVDKYEKKIKDKCFKENTDPLSRFMCMKKKVVKHLRIFLVIFLGSLISLIVCGVKAMRC